MISQTLILELEENESFVKGAIKLSAVLGIHVALLVGVMSAQAPLQAPPAAPLRLDVRTIEIPAPAAMETPRPMTSPPKALPSPARPTPSRSTPAKPPVVTAAPAAEPTPSPFSAPPQHEPPPQASAPPAPPTAVTPARFDVDYLQNPAPAYPPLSRRLQEAGEVLLLVRVTANGMAESVNIQKSSGYPRLDDAALKAVRQWRFVPARRGEEAIAANVAVPIVFRLDS
jgi:periplasmic protein TonB